MPRVALTDDQRRKNAAKDVYKAILDELNALRGRKRMTNQDFAEDLGISSRTWSRWNDGGLAVAEFGMVLDAVLKSGLTLTVTHPKQKEEIS